MLSIILVHSQCLNQEKNRGCPMDNQVTISGCPPKLLVVHDLTNKSGMSVARQLMRKFIKELLLFGHLTAVSGLVRCTC